MTWCQRRLEQILRQGLPRYHNPHAVPLHEHYIYLYLIDSRVRLFHCHSDVRSLHVLTREGGERPRLCTPNPHTHLARLNRVKEALENDMIGVLRGRANDELASVGHRSRADSPQARASC